MGKRLIVSLFVFLIGIGFASAASFDGATSNSGFSGSTNSVQRYQPSFSQLYGKAGDGFANIQTIWPGIEREYSDQCNSSQSDFIIGIPPGGCTPGVVRSDLLEEQNVPVFCQLYSVKVNPLIKVSSIKSISFSGDYPDGVQSVSFHPARAAVKSYKTLLGDPLVNNIGYVVIVLKREQVEDNMEDWISGNLTATLRYDAEDAYGTGAADYYLPVLGEENWTVDYPAYSFWNGMGYLRVSEIEENNAIVEVMKNRDDSVRTVRLEEGETSDLIYMPGYYCRAGMRLKLDKLVSSEDSVLLNIDGEEIWVREGSQVIDGQCKVTSITIEEDGLELEGEKESKGTFAEVRISCPGKERLVLKVSKNFEKTSLDALGESVKGFEENFENSNETVNELIEFYRSELKENGLETYGEEALLEQIDLAGRVGKFATQNALRELFVEKYPGSRAVDRLRYLLRQSNGYGYQEAYGSVMVANRFRSISLVDFVKKDDRLESVDINVGNKQYADKVEGNVLPLSSSESLELKKVNPGEVEVVYLKETKEGKKKEGPIIIEEGNRAKLGDHEVYVRKVVTSEVAHISLIPEVSHTKSEADFTFKIGVEKRNIQLSPERTIFMINNLNKSIEKWENINERLGNLIKAWKGACFATSGFLIAKNMVTGFSGEALARQKVMTKYKAICDTEYGGMSRTQCYNELSDDIDRDVASMMKALNDVNSQMEGVMSGGNYKTDGGLFGEGSITDQEEYKSALRSKMGSFEHLVEVNGEEVPVGPEDFKTTSQIRSAMLYKELKGTGTYAEEAAKEDFEKNVLNAAYEKQMSLAAQSSVSDLGVDSDDVVLMTSKNTRYFTWTGKKAADLGVERGETGSRPAQIVRDGSDTYLLILSPNSEGKMGVEDAYKKVGSTWSEEDNFKSNFKNVVFYDTTSDGACSNRWPDGKAAVSYYESGSSKGFPAIVPFDLENGWYAMVPNSGGTFIDDSPQGYTQSGDVSYFKICNIGTNRLMETGSGDDLCQSFSSNSAGSVEEFLPCRGLNSVEVKKLYGNAREAIRQASQGHDACTGNTKSSIRILGESMSCGAPMSQIGGYECQDFMSPADCKLMFNVCDPVICPPSRCDLGGKMPVSDVIQTGIVGSIFLCLPNQAEGIAVPVCVSGIHAGLESYLSILRSERDCLTHSLETGEHVGICDEITSVYKCEFFWRQLSPLMDMIVPKLVEGLYGGSKTRGGGEYLTVQHAWDTTQKSISYFQDTYAANAFRAFKLRSVEEAGSTVCKSFVGTSFPTSADAFGELLEPESPHQFYAQFSETLFTEATVPSTSQYKVYYHIYAGNDKGSQYRIYIKNPPESSYYRSNPTVIVDSGYIPKGQSIDETVDFTAPSGYKELCVVIDAEEECGFKQVTTDLGINYLTNKYTQEQGETSDITSENECISGSQSALTLANLNIQAGVEESLQPEIAMRGIVRVCASRNPGEGVEGTRWKDVGYCGDESLRCWLDIESIEGDLKQIEALENQSIKLLDERRGLIEDGQIPYEEVQSILDLSRQKIESLNAGNVNEYLNEPLEGSKIGILLSDLNKVIGDGDENLGSGTNQNRAEALSLRANVYQFVTEMIFRAESSKIQPGADRRVLGCSEDSECGKGKFCIDGECKSGEDKTSESSDSVKKMDWDLLKIYDALNGDNPDNVREEDIPLRLFTLEGDFDFEENLIRLKDHDLRGVSGGSALVVREGFELKFRVFTKNNNYFNTFPGGWENRNSDEVSAQFKKLNGNSVEVSLRAGDNIYIDVDGDHVNIDSTGDGRFSFKLGRVELFNKDEPDVNQDVEITLLDIQDVRDLSFYEGRTVRIVSKDNENLCIGVSSDKRGRAGESGDYLQNKVVLEPCKETNNLQVWKIQEPHFFMASNESYVLDIFSSGNLVQTFSKGNSENQKWSYDGKLIKSGLGDKCLTNSGDEGIVAESCKDIESFFWTFEDAELSVADFKTSESVSGESEEVNLLSLHYSPDYYGKESGDDFTVNQVKDFCGEWADYNVTFVTGALEGTKYRTIDLTCKMEKAALWRLRDKYPAGEILNSGGIIFDKFVEVGNGKDLCCYYGKLEKKN